ncbi:MAG: hypothetical protein ABIP94_02465 [Planctomycetota bacterium]
MRTRWLLTLVCLAACGGPGTAQGNNPRDGGLRDGVLLLPKGLREVSGIAAADERTLVCVQDEAGALFFVDLDGQRAAHAVVFGPPGDYEGLAKVGDDYWVLRSDGVLMHLQWFDGGLLVVGKHRLETPHKDWEGLCYDAARKMLLVLPKDRGGDTKEDRDERIVFAFDPVDARLRPELELVFSKSRLVEQAARRGLDMPSHTTGKGKTRIDLKLHCSEVSTVPGKRELLLLSGIDRTLLRVDYEGRLLASRVFDARELPRPEGMTYLPDGRLLVASEGVKGPGVVRVVKID